MASLSRNRLLFCTFCILFFSVSFLHAEHFSWQSSYESARVLAHKEHKNILVLLLDKHTPQTNKIIQESFINQEYLGELKKKFIGVIVLKDTKESYPIELLYTQTFPSLFFLSTEELFLCEPLEGIITPQKIQKKLSCCR